jgi:glycosyltransferase involved in cell wall biosynthesis
LNKTVLIYAHECAPYNRDASSIGAQRPYQFAKWLPDSGWNAIVLTCDSKLRYSVDPASNWKTQVHNTISNSMQNWDQTSSITIPLPSLAYDSIFDKWWLSSVSITDKGSFSPLPGKLLGLKRKIASVVKLKQGDYSQAWQKVARYAAECILDITEVTAQVACHGPDAGAFVAEKIYKEHNIPWVVDFRDPVFQPHGKLQLPAIKSLFNRFSKTWSASINVNHTLSKMDEDFFNKKAYTITNGYDEDEFDIDLEKNCLSDGDELKFLYTGNIFYPNQIISLFFELLNELKLKGIDYKFYYYGQSMEVINTYSQKYNVSDKVEIRDFVDRSEVASLLLSADIQVIFPMQESDGGYYTDGLLPGKFFEYLGSAKPILCMSEMNTMLERTIYETGSGLVSNNPKTIASLLMDYMSKGKKDAIATVKKVEIEKYKRRNQANQLAQVLNNIELNN